MTRATFQAAELADVEAMARIRAESWGTVAYWQARIPSYMSGELNPHHALAPRHVITAKEGGTLIGFIAGHLTRRYDCQGELEWIDVATDRRRSGVGSELLRGLAAWFAVQHATRVCVDVDPGNVAAREFYFRHGAESLNANWLVWLDISNLIHGSYTK